MDKSSELRYERQTSLSAKLLWLSALNGTSLITLIDHPTRNPSRISIMLRPNEERKLRFRDLCAELPHKVNLKGGDLKDFKDWKQNFSLFLRANRWFISERWELTVFNLLLLTRYSERVLWRLPEQLERGFSQAEQTQVIVGFEWQLGLVQRNVSVQEAFVRRPEWSGRKARSHKVAFKNISEG